MYRNILVSIFVVLSSMSGVRSFACGLVPPQEVVNIAQPLAYKDFPRMPDILAIMYVESRFKFDAVNRNHSGSGTSNGIMQVNGGLFDVEKNIHQGVAILRETYLITHSKAGAVKAYNVGIGNYLRNRMPTAAADYYVKFVKARRYYAKFPEITDSHGRHCGSVNGYVDQLQELLGFTSSAVLGVNQKASEGNYTDWGIQAVREQPAGKVPGGVGTISWQGKECYHVGQDNPSHPGPRTVRDIPFDRCRTMRSG